MTYDVKDTFRCYEIKISKSDFHSQCHNSFVGHLNYYVFPQKLYSEISGEVPDGIGVILYDGSDLKLIKRPKRKTPETDVQILKNSMIRSLDREADYYRKILDRETILKRDREISRLKEENRSLNQRNRNLYYELLNYKHPERVSINSDKEIGV